MPFESILTYAVTLSASVKYLLITVIAPFGGPLFSMGGGFLLHEGLVAMPYIFVAIALGDLVMDALWYGIGYRYGSDFIMRHGKRIALTPELFERVKTLFEKRGAWILFISKLVMGLGMMPAILVTAGATRIRFWKYMLVNALGEAVWVSGALYVGYAYGNFYATLKEEFRIAGFVGTLFIFTALFFMLSKFFQKHAIERP